MTMVLWACIAVIGVSLLATLLLMVRTKDVHDRHLPGVDAVE